MPAARLRVGVPVLDFGNFRSVLKVIERNGGQACALEEPGQVASVDRLVLAGVGAFDQGMRSLNERGWVDALNAAVIDDGKPILGICLGMQLMCRASDEGSLPGLGWVDAHVRRLEVPTGSGLKIPHMGWNTVQVRRPNPLIPTDEGEQRFYFVHSYQAICADPSEVIATSRHGTDLTAAFARRNIYGVQFHPEKSHRFGVALLGRFMSVSC